MLQTSTYQFGAHIGFLPIIVALVSANGIDVLQQFGAIAFIILITILVAEILNDSMSRWVIYPVLIGVDIFIMVFLGLEKPFHGLFGICLIWATLIVPFSAWALLTANYLYEQHGTPFIKTGFLLVPAFIALAVLYWILVRT